MTESKRIDNLRIKIAQYVEDKLAQDEKSWCVVILYYKNKQRA